MSTQHHRRNSEFLDFAHQLADLSGGVILPKFRKRIAFSDKPGKSYFDPVTAADRAAERAVRKMIAARWPNHAIAGEEFDDTPGTSPYRWIIDPIDGTRAFMIGMPVWGTLIALTADNQPILGIMDQPFTGERFWATKTARYRGPDGRTSRLKTRACPDIGAAMLSTTHPDLFNPGTQANAFRRVKSSVRDTRYGGDCYAYCLLAAGHIDIVMEANLKPHDIAALIPIIEGAGGAITSWSGGPATAGGNILACGDKSLHAEVLKLIA